MGYKVGDIVRYKENLVSSLPDLVGMVIEITHYATDGDVKIQLFDQTNSVPIRQISINNKRWEVLNG